MPGASLHPPFGRVEGEKRAFGEGRRRRDRRATANSNTLPRKLAKARFRPSQNARVKWWSGNSKVPRQIRRERIDAKRPGGRLLGEQRAVKDAGGSRTHLNRSAAGGRAVWLQRPTSNVLARNRTWSATFAESRASRHTPRTLSHYLRLTDRIRTGTNLVHSQALCPLSYGQHTLFLPERKPWDSNPQRFDPRPV